MMIGDAISVALSSLSGFKRSDFGRNHPGGSLGKSFIKVKEIMINERDLPYVDGNISIIEAMETISKKGYGLGLIKIGRSVSGIFTDGDLRRELNKISSHTNLQKFINKTPMTVNENMPASKALSIMNEKKITSLLVVSDKDANKRKKVLKGIIHIHFLLQTGIG